MLVLALAALAASPAGAQQGNDEIDVRSDVTFDASDGTALALDAYLPKSGERLPAILLVHGGSWAGGDKHDLVNIGAGLASMGWATFALNYRLGAAMVRRQTEDVLDAIVWIRDHSAEYRVDPDKISLLGASAGGHLAALAAGEGRAGRGRDSRVAALATWSGIFDLAALAPRDGAPISNCAQQCQEFFGAGLLTGVVGCTYEDCPKTYRDLSPIDEVGADDPPSFLASATDDAVPPAQARAMVAALHRKGVEAEALIVKGTAHGYEVGARTLDRTLEFLDGRTLPEEAASSDASDSTRWMLVAGVGAIAIAGLVAVIAVRRRRRSSAMTR